MYEDVVGIADISKKHRNKVGMIA